MLRNSPLKELSRFEIYELLLVLVGLAGGLWAHWSESGDDGNGPPGATEPVSEKSTEPTKAITPRPEPVKQAAPPPQKPTRKSVPEPSSAGEAKPGPRATALNGRRLVIPPPEVPVVPDAEIGGRMPIPEQLPTGEDNPAEVVGPAPVFREEEPFDEPVSFAEELANEVRLRGLDRPAADPVFVRPRRRPAMPQERAYAGTGDDGKFYPRYARMWRSEALDWFGRSPTSGVSRDATVPRPSLAEFVDEGGYLTRPRAIRWAESQGLIDCGPIDTLIPKALEQHATLGAIDAEVLKELRQLGDRLDWLKRELPKTQDFTDCFEAHYYANSFNELVDSLK